MSITVVEHHKYKCDLCGYSNTFHTEEESTKDGWARVKSRDVCDDCALLIYHRFKKYLDGLKNDKAA